MRSLLHMKLALDFCGPNYGATPATVTRAGIVCMSDAESGVHLNFLICPLRSCLSFLPHIVQNTTIIVCWRCRTH